MEKNEIKTVGIGPAALGLEETLDGWSWALGMIKESFSSIDKAYNPAQEMLTKEHETYLRMAEDSNNSDEIRINASQNARDSSTAARSLASDRMDYAMAIFGTVVMVAAAALGGTRYIK